MESLSQNGRYYIAFVDWEESAYVLPGEIHRDNLPGESVVREGVSVLSRGKDIGILYHIL